MLGFTSETSRHHGASFPSRNPHPSYAELPLVQPPGWFTPVAIVALLWNLLGCAAYLSDVMTSPEALTQMTSTPAMYAARPAWAVAATAVAVWFGAAGCLGLILRKRWAVAVLAASLAGVIVQDLAIFVLSKAGAEASAAAYAAQGLVLIVAIGLVLLARRAKTRGWLASPTPIAS
jgi:hypothetical protein